MSQDKIKIELTEEEAQMFKWCWKNFKILNCITRIKSGRAVLHLKNFEIKKTEFDIYNPEVLNGFFKM